MSLVISFLNQKGGVGKTNLSINVAACLTTLGQKVLLMIAFIERRTVELEAKE